MCMHTLAYYELYATETCKISHKRCNSPSSYRITMRTILYVHNSGFCARVIRDRIVFLSNIWFRWRKFIFLKLAAQQMTWYRLLFAADGHYHSTFLFTFYYWRKFGMFQLYIVIFLLDFSCFLLSPALTWSCFFLLKNKNNNVNEQVPRISGCLSTHIWIRFVLTGFLYIFTV